MNPAANFRARDNGPWVLVSHLSFEAPVEPRGWARARHNGASGRFFTDPATRAYKADLALFARQAMTRSGIATAVGPLRVEIEAWFTRPQSHAKGRGAAIEPHTSKPDKDNIEKAVLDALSGVAWADDARVAQGETSKWWLPHGQSGRVAVSIWRIER